MYPKFTIYWLLSGFSDAIQIVAITWMAFELTGSATVVAIVGILLYLPGVFFGFLKSAVADRGVAQLAFSRTNGLLALAASLTGFLLFLVDEAWFSLLLGGILVAGLSIVKVLNKALVGRMIRENLDQGEARSVLQKGSSLNVLGTGLGSLVVGSGYTHLGVGGLLLISAICLFLVYLSWIRGHSLWNSQLIDRDSGLNNSTLDMGNDESVNNDLRHETFVRLLLLYTLLASGVLSFVNTIMVPYVGDVLKQGVGYYSILSAFGLLGSFAAGLLLRLWPGFEAISLRYGMLLGLFPAVVLIWFQIPLVAVVAVFSLSCVLTSAILAIQIQINLEAPRSTVGSSSLRRSSSAGLSKAIFSILGGILADVLSPLITWGIAVVYLFILGIWWSYTTHIGHGSGRDSL